MVSRDNTSSSPRGTPDVGIGSEHLIPAVLTGVPDDLHERTSIFYLIGVFGSAMSGVFGFLFSKMDGVSGLEGWRWIFIMEGIITCCIALAGYMFMVDFPDNAHKAWRFLTEKEGAFIIRRINRDRLDAEPEAFSFQRFLRPALDLKIWGFALLFW